MLASFVTVDPRNGILRRYERNSDGRARPTHIGGVVNWPTHGTADIPPSTVEGFRCNPPAQCAMPRAAKGASKPLRPGPIVA